MKMPWLRLYSEARSDPKLEMLTDAQHRVWFRLLCYANDQPIRGTVIYRSTKLLAVQVARGDEALLIETLDVLTELDIITHSDDQVGFVHWNERQYDKPSDAPEAVRERVSRHRASVSGRSNASEIPVKRGVTPSNAVKRTREEGEEREQKQNRETEQTTTNTWQIDHPPSAAHREAETPPSSEDTSTIATQVQTAANLYSKAMVALVEEYTPKLSALGKDIVTQAAVWRDSFPDGTVKSFSNWLRIEAREDAPARASPSPPHAKKFKVFEDTAA